MCKHLGYFKIYIYCVTCMRQTAEKRVDTSQPTLDLRVSVNLMNIICAIKCSDNSAHKRVSWNKASFTRSGVSRISTLTTQHTNVSKSQMAPSPREYEYSMNIQINA